MALLASAGKKVVKVVSLDTPCRSHPDNKCEVSLSVEGTVSDLKELMYKVLEVPKRVIKAFETAGGELGDSDPVPSEVHLRCAKPPSEMVDFLLEELDHFETRKCDHWEDDYEKVAKLGEGGYGEVFHCRRDGEDFALKEILFSRVVGSYAAVRRLLVEVAVMVYLPEHPGLVRCKQLLCTGESLCIVMPLVPGENLLKYVNRTRGVSEEVMRIILPQLFEALSLLHSVGIVHRDIKHENVMINPHTYDVVLIDFGLAKYFPRSSGHFPGVPTKQDLAVQQKLFTPSSCTPVTAWTPVGTQTYLAPETRAMLRSRTGVPDAVICSIDLYGVGLLAYTCTTVKRPFVRVGEESILRTNRQRWLKIMDDRTRRGIIEEWQIRSLDTFHRTSEEMRFLLESLCRYSGAERCTAPEALKYCLENLPRGFLGSTGTGRPKVPFEPPPVRRLPSPPPPVHNDSPASTIPNDSRTPSSPAEDPTPPPPSKPKRGGPPQCPLPSNAVPEPPQQADSSVMTPPAVAHDYRTGEMAHLLVDQNALDPNYREQADAADTMT